MSTKRLVDILTNNQKREKNFQSMNNTPLGKIVDKYPAMSGIQDPNNLYAACVGVYPGSTFNTKEQKGNNDNVVQLNYINIINDNFKKQYGQAQPSIREDFMNYNNNNQQQQDQYPYKQYSQNQTNYQVLDPSNVPESQYKPFQNQGQIQEQAQEQAPDSLVTNGGLYGTSDIDYQTFAKQFNQPIQSSEFNHMNQQSQQYRNDDIYDTSNGNSDNYGTLRPYSEYGQFSANSPESMYLQNVDSRPIVDFTHNNMVPFSRKFTQNMAGTGVRSGSEIDGIMGTFDSGSDMSTPYQAKLGMFTGVDDTYMHKRETGPNFSPVEQQTGFVYGAPLIREDTDQYTQSLTTRRDLRPVESVMVGPGLDIDPDMPANGGFHDFTRVMPNNVSDYKANQLEGRINAGKLVSGGGLPESYPGIGGSMNNSNMSGVSGMKSGGIGVVKNRPPSYWSQARRPTMSTKVSGPADGQMQRSEYQVDFKPNNALRSQTSFGYGSLSVGKPSNNNAPVFQAYYGS